jgi:hypothetical protein
MSQRFQTWLITGFASNDLGSYGERPTARFLGCFERFGIPQAWGKSNAKCTPEANLAVGRLVKSLSFIVLSCVWTIRSLRHLCTTTVAIFHHHNQQTNPQRGLHW